ncbi:hypothetical protein PENTCL1PPCAC_3762, partial [Pristionchus entomophagus]
FFQIFIDHNFLEFFEKVISTPSLKSLKLIDIVFDTDLGYNGIERFLSLLISRRPTYLKLVFVEDPWAFLDQRFLVTYVHAVPLAEVALYDRENTFMLRPTNKFSEVLFMFKSIDLPSILLDTNWILPEIVVSL